MTRRAVRHTTGRRTWLDFDPLSEGTPIALKGRVHIDPEFVTARLYASHLAKHTPRATMLTRLAHRPVGNSIYYDRARPPKQPTFSQQDARAKPVCVEGRAVGALGEARDFASCRF